MNRYQTYKESGIRWIGEIPEGWDVRRIKTIASYSRGSGIQRSEVIPEGKPCVRYGELYTTYRHRITNPVSFIPEDLWESSTIVQPQDLIMALTGEKKEEIGPTCVNASDNGFAASGDTLVIRPRGQDGRFLAYAMNADYFASQKALDANGEIIVHLGADKVGNEIVVLPKLNEQQIIADYLDAKTAEIDMLVEDCEREVNLLREYRKVVVFEAVTKGLDSDVPMKDSGVEWIGEIPEVWQVARLDKVAIRKSGHTPDKKVAEYWDGDIVWISLADSPRLRLEKYVSKSTSMTTKAGIANSSAEMLPAGAVLLSRDATVGLTAIAAVPLAVSQHFMAYICDSNLSNEYLRYVFLAMEQEFLKLSMGSTIPTIGLPLVKQLSIPYPERRVQDSVVEHLDAKIGEIDSLIDAKQSMADKLREYRKSLISEAVTGKFKVPGVQ